MATATASTDRSPQDFLLELEAVAWEMERRGIASPDFGAWISRARSEFRWDAPHFRVMQETLDRVTAGELLRVIFQIPIRHGKSEHNTVSYNAYRLELEPSARLIVASHNQQQAHKFSRQIRRQAEARGVAMSADRNAAGEWETTEGGGVVALGAGAGTASLNADLITVDDPVGGREKAESQAERDRIWDWLTNDVLSRTEPHTPVVLTMSRWHQDDLVGRLLDGQAGEWHVVDLPGLAEDRDALGRAPGEPLWPALRSREWMEQKLAELGSYGFASLIQGRPRPREGGMFKWEWWGLVDAVPAQGQMVRYWDLAGTDSLGGGHDPDFSAGALLCRMGDGRTAVVDMERFRHSVAARNARILEVCRHDLARYRGRIAWWIETEAGIQGKERTAELVRALQNQGMPTHTEHPTGSKVARAEPLAAKAEAGNVVLCPGEWRDAFRLEASDFPGGKHDDQVDAAAGADAKLAARNVATVRKLRI